MKSLGVILGALLVTTVLATPQVAKADTFYLNQDNSGGQLGGNLPNPGYGTVQVTTVGSDLEFQVALAPNWFVDTGVHHAVAFGISQNGLQLSGTSGSLSALTVPFVQAVGNSFVNPGFSGPLNYAIDCNSAGNGANSCNGIASLGFFVLNGAPSFNSDIYFSVDLISNITGQTGVAGGEYHPHPVPGPIVGAGLPGLLTALVGLVALNRRRKQKLNLA